MLVFLVPFKSARAAACWDRACRLLARTLASACAQTSRAFRVVVVCHELPEGDFADPALEFVQADHPAPSPSNPDDLRADKKRKLLIALRSARKHAPSHVMFLDADDLVSRRLAAFVAANPQANGWFLRSGYFHCERQPRLHLERRRFDQWCGSSHIVRPEHLEFLDRMDDRRFYFHTRLTRDLRRQGTPIRPLPFRGGIYSIAHGENFRDYERILWPDHPVLGGLRRVAFQRALTPDIRREFGLYPVV
jgi:hypothetical protein